MQHSYEENIERSPYEIASGNVVVRCDTSRHTSIPILAKRHKTDNGKGCARGEERWELAFSAPLLASLEGQNQCDEHQSRASQLRFLAQATPLRFGRLLGRTR